MYDGAAEEAASFYCQTLPDSSIDAIRHAPADNPSTPQGTVLVVEFTLMGMACIAVNGGPSFRHTQACSIQISTETQAETDAYWEAIIGHGGAESLCGWCCDKWGVSWQITPRTLTEAMAAGGDEARRAFAAMMQMKKIDVAAIDAARRGA
jgi:predicted 3-demethylubiquinone-9 3-methyltransferase (glyoxalase superfamily)